MLTEVPTIRWICAWVLLFISVLGVLIGLYRRDFPHVWQSITMFSAVVILWPDKPNFNEEDEQ